MSKISGDFSQILSVKFRRMGRKAHLSEVSRRIAAKKQTVIFTPNTQILLSAQKSKEEARVVRKADLLIPDGAGVYLASRLLRTPLPERMGGIDFAEQLLILAEKKGLGVFLLGGKEGVASKAASRLKEHHPSLCICGTHHGYFNKHGKENDAVKEKIKRASPDLLFVCFGYPLQEKWILENLPSLACVRVAIGLGGSLDVWAGNLRRAPVFFQKLGLEWLWRVMLEPRRAAVFIDIPKFLLLVLRQRVISAHPSNASAKSE